MRRYLILSTTLSLLLVGCSGTETILVGGKKTDVPAWVLEPDNTPGRSGVYYGVGSAKVDNIDVSRYNADQFATRDLIKKLEQRIHNRSTHKTSEKNGVDQPENEILTTYYSEGIIQGVRIVKRFITPDGTWYSKAMLNINRPDSNFESELKQQGTPDVTDIQAP